MKCYLIKKGTDAYVKLSNKFGIEQKGDLLITDSFLFIDNLSVFTEREIFLNGFSDEESDCGFIQDLRIFDNVFHEISFLMLNMRAESFLSQKRFLFKGIPVYDFGSGQRIQIDQDYYNHDQNKYKHEKVDTRPGHVKFVEEAIGFVDAFGEFCDALIDSLY